MITKLFVIFFVLFLKDGEATPNELYRPRSFTDLLFKQNSVTELNIEDFMYIGEPIYVACVSNENQTEFDMEEVNCAGGVSQDLIKKLSNGKGISLFFHGIGNRISKDGRFFEFAKEWFAASQKNICAITYAFYESTTLMNVVFHLHDMVRTKRIEFVAKQARDLVLGVRDYCIKNKRKTSLKRMSEVDVTGFSYGAHIASKTCQYLFWKTKQKVKMLLALDPAKIPFFLSKPNPAISKNDAEYVQVIHTSFYGMNERVGHVDIFVDYKSDGGQVKHALALYVHVATATRRLFMMATDKGNGTVTKGRGQTTPTPKRNECLIGLYGTMNRNNDGKRFEFSLTKHKIPFWHTVCEYRNSEMFFMEEPEDDSSSFIDITESSLTDDLPSTSFESTAQESSSAPTQASPSRSFEATAKESSLTSFPSPSEELHRRSFQSTPQASPSKPLKTAKKTSHLKPKIATIQESPSGSFEATAQVSSLTSFSSPTEASPRSSFETTGQESLLTSFPSPTEDPTRKSFQATPSRPLNPAKKASASKSKTTTREESPAITYFKR
ncbi:uncharacterized protein LOC116348362 [Contarinia nasturtii]|uniref:uncharacterized protein LOC116348362 n=1 Tax=Contarinia nasturtii TaxID=265458 RepID=UPI0012D40BB8|nr:uncharacterized protein LOC116348362 [Contarinia nasturtii]